MFSIIACITLAICIAGCWYIMFLNFERGEHGWFSFFGFYSMIATFFFILNLARVF